MRHWPDAFRALWRRAAAWQILAIGAVLSISVWRLVLGFENRVIASHFRGDVLERDLAIQEQLRNATFELEDISSLYAVSGDVSRDQFRKFVTPILARHRALRTLSFGAVVPAERRKQYEAAATAGSPPYRIRERSEAGELVPASHRAEHVVVQLIEPYAGNETSLGFDVASEPVRRRALERARDSGELAVSAPLALIQESGSRSGVLAFLPEYRKGEPVDTVAARRAALQGFLVAVLELDEILKAALGLVDPSEIDVYLLQGPADKLHIVSYEHGAHVSPRASPDASPSRLERALASRLHHVTPFTWGALEWRVVTVATDNYLLSRRSWAPSVTLLGGLLVTGLLSSWFFTLSGRTTRIEREVVRQERTEKALRESEERLRLTVDAIADGGWDWNLASGDVFFSDSWLASLGYQRTDVRPHIDFWRYIVHPDDYPRSMEALQAHLDGLTPVYECENRLRAKSGAYRWNLDRGKVVAWDEAGKPIRMVGTDTDIGERRRAEDEKRRLEEKVHDAQKLESLGLLAGGIAHDFNNLLVGILGSADLALGQVPPGAAVRQDLEQIKLSASRAAELTREILAYAGQGRFVIEPVDPAAMAREMGGLLESSISKNATLCYDFGPEPLRVLGDATQLRQVLMNLITNASEALGGSRGTIVIRTCRMDAAASQLASFVPPDLPPGPYVCMGVSDTGCGIDAETCPKIFDPFFTTKSQGRGLGLASVLGIVRGHGGAIRLQSQPGAGTTFTVLLPLADVGAGAGAADPAPASESWSGAGTVLVVDDEATMRRVASRILSKAGFTVLTAADGRDGVRVFREHAGEISAVVLDATMPRMNGEEAFHAMRGIRPDVAVILSSGYAEEEALERFPTGALAGFLRKPFQASDLLERVRASIAG